MKKLLSTLFAISTLFAFAQAPQEISYQGVARNVSGTILANQNIGIKLDLHQGSAAGSVVFTETHSKTTNSFGLFTLGIGSINTAGFTAINWGSGPYFMEVSMDPAGGTAYISVGTQQFMSVPYALYAQTSGNASPTPTITINAPNTVTSAAGSYSINIPLATVYTAGTGINISGGVITNTLVSTPPTITGVGSATVTASGNTFTVNTPVYTSGTGINISGGVITNTATTTPPTITGVGAATVTSSGNTFTVNTPVPPVYTPGTGINISGGVITNTATTTPPTITGAGSATVTTSGNTFTVNTPVPPVYTAGSGIGISGGVISNTVVAPTLSVTGNNISINPGNTQALPNYSLTQSGANINLTQNGASIATITLTAATSTSLSAGNSNIILNQSGNAYTITPVTPTFTNSGLTTITGSYPNYTVNSVASPSTSLVAGNTNIQLIPGTNSYTLNAYSYSLTNNSNTLTLSNGAPFSTPSTVVVPTQTLSVGSGSISISGGNSVAIPSSSTTLVQGNNVTLNQSGNTYTVSAISPTFTPNGPTTITGAYPNLTINSTASPSTTLVQGNNVTLNQSGNTYTVNAAPYSLSSNSNTLTLTNGTVVSTATVPVQSAYVGTTNNVTVTSNTINLATTAVTAGTYGINASNSVPTFSVDNFGRLTSANQYTPTVAGDVIGSINTSTVSKLRGVNISTLAPTANQVLEFNAGSWTPTTIAPAVITGTGTGIATVTAAVNNFTVNVPMPIYTATTGVLSFGTNTVAVAPKLTLTGNALASGPLTNSVNISSISPWVQSVGSVTLSNIGDKVGIGTTSPSSNLHVINIGTTTSAGIFDINNASNPNNTLEVYNSGIGTAIFATNTSSTNAAANFNNSGTGMAVNVYNTSNSDPAVNISNYGSYDGIHAYSAGGRAIYAQSNATVGASAIEAIHYGSGTGLYVSKAPTSTGGNVAYLSNTSPTNTSDAVQISNIGTGNTLNAINTNTSVGSAGTFSNTNGSTTLNSINSGGGIALNAFANAGSAISAQSSGGASPTIYAYNSGSGDVMNLFGATNGGKAIYATNNSSTNPTIDANNSGVGPVFSGVKSSAGNVATFNNSLSTNAADVVLVNNTGTGAGITVVAASGRGISVSNTSSVEAAGQFNNNNTFHSLYAAKNATTTGGNAARIENNSTSNFGDAMYVSNLGGGAAIHAVSGPTITGGTNAALWLEAGHVKSTQTAAPSAGTFAFSSGTVLSGYAANVTVDALNTDTKGAIHIAPTGNISAAIAGSGDYIVNITYSKAYVNSPVVVVSPNSNLFPPTIPNLNLSYYVTSNTTGFSLHVTYRASGVITSIAMVPIHLSYMVIE